jgi:hypothetical protein
MAATSVPVVTPSMNAGLLDGGGTQYDVSNGMTIPNAPENLLVRLTNTDDDTGLTVTFKAGDYPPALAAGQGDLAVTVAFGTTQWVCLESGRFLQSDGSISVTATVNTGKITPIKVPRH